jgi:DNA-binding HxlR family transcriptional regulator
MYSYNKIGGDILKKYNLGIEATLEIHGGKWKALIVCLLMSGAKRTSELESDGIVGRINYHQMPPKVEYYVTEYGKTANEIIDVMCSWGRENIKLRRSQREDINLLEK